MKLPKAIDYVDLPTNLSAEQRASFYFRRLQGTMLLPTDDLPHRHNYQEILAVESGHGRHAIDGQGIDLQPYTVSLISKGQVHVFEHATNLTGCIVRFTDEFLPAGLISQTWNYHATLFNQLARAPTLAVPSSDFNVLNVLLDQIEIEWMHQTTFQSESALRHLLSVLLIRLERVYQHALHADQQQHAAYRVYQQFATVLEQHFVNHHDVQYYAAALQLPPVKLSKLLGRLLGKPTKQLIDERLVLEAKRYLHYTNLSLKEIAGALGYSDPFHLSKTFKRLTGVTPQVYREQRQKLT